VNRAFRVKWGRIVDGWIVALALAASREKSSGTRRGPQPKTGWAIVAGTAFPLSVAAQVVGGAQNANGVRLEVAAGDYATADTSQSVLTATNGGVLITGGAVRLVSTGANSSGVSAQGIGSRVEIHGSEIKAQGIAGKGIDVFIGGSVLFRNSIANTSGNYASGAYLYGPGGHVDISGSSLGTQGREAHGVYVGWGPGSGAVIADTLIRTTGQFAHGFFLDYDNNRATLDRVDIWTKGDYSSATWIPRNSALTVRDSRLQSDGACAVGMDVRGSVVDVERTRVVTHGVSSHGLYASKEFATDAAIRASDVNVVTTGKGAVGAVARLGGQVSLQRGRIGTSGDNAYGVFAGGAGSVAQIVDGAVTTTGAGAHGLYASRNSALDLQGTNIRTEGAGAWAAAVYGGTLSVDGGSLVSSRHGAIDASNAVIDLKNGAQVVGGNGTLLSVDATSGNPVSLSMDNGVDADGDIANQEVAGGGEVPAVTDVALSRGSSWNGATDAVRDLSVESGSVWTVTGNSTVGSVALNDSVIAFDAPVGGAYKQLVLTGDYAASGGKLVVNTVLGDDGSPTDKLVIDGGHASGDTGVVVKRTGGDGAQTNVGIQIVEIRNGGTTDVAAFTLDEASDGYRKGFDTLSAGGYDYMLKRGGNAGNADDWYLVSAAEPVYPEPGGEEAIEAGDAAAEHFAAPPPVPRRVAPEPDAYLANAAAATMMPIHTLHQRQDQALRMAAHDAQGIVDGAVWLRVEGQTASLTDGGRDLSGNGRLIHAGADVLRFNDGGEGSFRIGAMGMYGGNTSWSTRSLWNAITESDGPATARGSVEGYNVGLYGTWYGSRDILSGPHVDTWLMSGTYSNRVGGSLAGDSYRSRTVTGSLEAGYSFEVYDRGGAKMYVEPQAQVVYSHYHAGGRDAPAGRISTQNSNNVLTRLGVRLHGSMPTTSSKEMRPFMEANWWHGPTSPSVTIDGNAFGFGLPRDRAEVKTGVHGQVTKNLAVSASIGVESNLGDYAIVKGQLAAKYRWE
jgi:autotransporter family porin